MMPGSRIVSGAATIHTQYAPPGRDGPFPPKGSYLTFIETDADVARNVWYALYVIGSNPCRMAPTVPGRLVLFGNQPILLELFGFYKKRG